MVNKILKKSVDLGKKVADTQAFEEYLGRLTENFLGEVKDKIKPATTIAVVIDYLKVMVRNI